MIATDALTLARQIRGKEVSPVAVVDAVLHRIEALQPTVNAFITVTADEAREAARRAEAAGMAGAPLGQLHGVPFSVKDLLFTKGVRTTMGSFIFAEQGPGEDAVPVRRLGEAGAILIAKTTTPEFGHKPLTDSPLFGVTRNPWDLSRTPGGSSGGAAGGGARGQGGAAPRARRRGGARRRLRADLSRVPPGRARRPHRLAHGEVRRPSGQEPARVGGAGRRMVGSGLGPRVGPAHRRVPPRAGALPPLRHPRVAYASP